MDWQGPGGYFKFPTTVKAVGKDGSGSSDEKNGERAGKKDSKERDNSRGRRLLQNLFGSAGLAAAYAGMQDSGPVLVHSDLTARSASVPPQKQA